jgi:hypothetical protein
VVAGAGRDAHDADERDDRDHADLEASGPHTNKCDADTSQSGPCITGLAAP